MLTENYKEYFGKFLFLTSIIALVFILISPLNSIIYAVDEYFTLGLIKFPLMQGITITMSDVHPPLYYVLLKFCIKIFSPFNLDIIQLSKMVTIIPYLIILFISATKIKNEYNWLTAGLFTFALFSMTEFFMFYSTIRMYSWACLFLVLSFIYLKDVINKSDLKSWSLFTLFTLLGAYTHYFCAISSICIYLMLLVFFRIYSPSFIQEFKKFVISIIALIIGYAPWGIALITQLNKVHGNFWIPPINLNYFLQSLTYFTNSTFGSVIMVLSIIFLISILIVSLLQIKQNKESFDEKYILMGILVYILTLLLAVIISFTFKPILRVRYLLPASAVLWFAVSVLIGKVENNKIFSFLLILMIIIGVFGIVNSVSSTQSSYEKGVQDQSFLSGINNENSTVLFIGSGEVIQFGTILNETNKFTDYGEAYGVKLDILNELFDFKYTKDFNKTMIKYKNDDIYLFIGDWRDSYLIEDKEPIYNFRTNNVYKIN